MNFTARKILIEFSFHILNTKHRTRETTAASNAYVAVLELRPPPEGQLEPEPEAYVPPEVRN